MYRDITNEKNGVKSSKDSKQRPNETFFTSLISRSNEEVGLGTSVKKDKNDTQILVTSQEGGLETSTNKSTSLSLLPEEAGLEAAFHKSTLNLLPTSTNGLQGDTLENGLGTSQNVETKIPGPWSPQVQSKQKHKFGLFTCIAIVASCIVGSGILAQPQGAYQHANTALICILIWFTYGLIAIMGALCYAEFGTTLPQLPGEYSYICEIFGPFLGFLYQWSSIFVIIPVSRAIMAIMVAHNLISPYVENNKCHPNVGISWGIKCLAIVVIVILSIFNCMSRSVVSKLNGTLFIIKLIAVGSIMSCGIVFMSEHGIYTYSNFTFVKSQGRHSDSNPQPLNACEAKNNVDTLASYDRSTASEIVMAVYQVSFSYLGFNHLNFIAEDVRNPQRNLPLAIFISLPAIVFVYVFVNFTYFVTMSGVTIVNTDIIVHDLYKAVIPERAHRSTLWFAPTVVAIAVAGSLMSQIISTARVPFIGARNGHVPKFLALVDKKHFTPSASIIFTSLLAIFLVLANGNAKTLISIGSYLQNAFIVVTVCALIRLRFKQPNLHRPIKLPIALPIIYVVINVVLLCTPILTINAANPTETLLFVCGAMFTVATGIPIYFFLVRNKTKPTCLLKFNDLCTLYVGKLLNAIPENQSESK